MKVITITDNNINEVYGRLRKFFYNNNTTAFESWRNFDCGFKKHISKVVKLGNKKVRYTAVYSDPEVNWYGHDSRLPGIHIYIKVSMNYDINNGFILGRGDKIAFCGNRIIIRTEGLYNNYIYEVYQATPVDEYRYLALGRQPEEYYEIL